jgi:DNA-binding NarL/FixJ family response regulator
MRRRLLIVDDDPAFRRLARALLDGPFEVVGDVATRTEALRELEGGAADVVLLDVHLPDGDGFAVAREIADAGDAVAVLLTSSDDFSGSPEEVRASGAAGFVPKADVEGARLRALLDDR